MDYDVIIVGMGPVGALCANLAGLWGLNALVVEKSETVYANPRAMGFDHEVMRVFGNIGLADSIAEHVMPYRPSEYRTTGSQLIKRIDAAQPPFPLGWAPNYVFSQPPVERALREKIARFKSVTVELGSEVLSVDSAESQANVRIQAKDGTERTVTAAHVLACDGGTSPIRTRLGLKMDDLAFDEPWLVVDVILNEGAGEDLPKTNVQFCELARPCTFVVGPGRHRRWEFMINPDEQPSEISKPEMIKKLISRWLPEQDYQLWRASAYRFHALILEQWKADRVFFLGDAAHMTPPFLAQGMCQGIRDALNLVWKIALVKEGLAAPEFLETYQIERIPHVRQTTLAAKEFGGVICERDSERAANRDARLIEHMKENPGGTIRQSLIPGLSQGFIAQVSPAGELFPQPMVIDHVGKRALLDEFTGQVFRVVVAPGFDATALLRCLRSSQSLKGLPIHVVRLVNPEQSGARAADEYQEVDGLLAQWLEQRGCNVVIVRPDHYVYGGAVTVAWAMELLEGMELALWCKPPQKPTSAQGGVCDKTIRFEQA
ncbi:MULTISPECIES: bifunctional 3-(3-hydroxy-phenyl)propionate/3-hydroxycinnamic acid hydroxylase [Pseudomonas]|jgi:3-(3-hydroxy-phenyl)propionate hydroxylase|uniref:bifunctional 3-(3-hydroxy-phenyl)propionate/3-hydroxycinnamic acid hydroxylase n=1 Tax=Pseudomonas TaxID=286 RepID=UPI001E2FEE54|nr:MULTISPECIES: bifunctional 3-(3-hydroxy-phenyl)propionate/3-hydroxycinnamic acid hydroxylase [Pseudomonas]MCD9114788.1 bifunctional 3-(3-hydroxy-phenyl)propionate/3-hydroxycinnamic acid hydroxylase [Pseudomonas bijieensis]MDD2030777.1 bifunctional 3-(3-hydroxy-phenyl)propionate/3-hydroxycinnamic acid hydroxylase [Pseudomonas sp. 39167]